MSIRKHVKACNVDILAHCLPQTLKVMKARKYGVFSPDSGRIFDIWCGLKVKSHKNIFLLFSHSPSCKGWRDKSDQRINKQMWRSVLWDLNRRDRLLRMLSRQITPETFSASQTHIMACFLCHHSLEPLLSRCWAMFHDLHQQRSFHCVVLQRAEGYRS